MAVIKRTFSIPDEVSKQLNSAVPSQGRLMFVTNILTQVPKEKKRKKLLDALDSIKPWKVSEEPVVDIIRKIRAQETAK